MNQARPKLEKNPKPRHVERCVGATMPTSRRQAKRKREGGTFQVVPAGFSTAQQRSDCAAGPPKQKRNKQNTLRQAFSGAMSKADEIWFRKCGHGERLFTSYYRRQEIMSIEEWPQFEAVLRKTLPVTFRFRDASGKGSSSAREARAALEERMLALGAAAPVPWAPASGIWQAAEVPDEKALSKSGRPLPGQGGRLGKGSNSEALAAALADGVAQGLLNRQEIVSMLPVLALRVPKGSCVLDTCASPGSKTMMLLEAVSSGGCARGMVVANDAHPKRVATLLDAIDRHHRPDSERSRLVVTCHRGEAFPFPARPFRKGEGNGEVPPTGFDRVLCDVPCSGDGTIRKDRTVLPRWTPAVGTQLHAVQLEIAWRGLQLLQAGGLMAYSTCSLNPVEDEAVVAALLSRADAMRPGAVELEAWPVEVLPHLIRRPGKSSWRVADHVECLHLDDDDDDDDKEEGEDEDDEVKLRWHRDHGSAVAAGMPHVTPTLWPPPATVADRMHLERCSRLLPHDQDHGGFFIALLRKRAPLSEAGAEEQVSMPALPSTGPAGCRELPALPAEDEMKPIQAAVADELGAAHGIKNFRRRLLRRSSTPDAPVHLAPAALAAFTPGTICVAHAGLPFPV
jgi:tRNA (cytosine34-C5)-methyltransferase